MNELEKVLRSLNISFTQKQWDEVVKHPQRLAFYEGLRKLKGHGMINMLPTEFVLMCVDALLADKETPKITASIICELELVEALFTMERAQAVRVIERAKLYLRAIGKHPNKSALRCAFSLLNCFDFTFELSQIYIESMLDLIAWTQTSANSPDIAANLNRARIFLAQIANIAYGTELELVCALTMLSRLLRDSELCLQDQLDLMSMVFAHPRQFELAEGLEFIDECSYINQPLSEVGLIFLKTVLKDRATPDITGNLLMMLVGDDSMISAALAQAYCDKVTAYSKKAYLSALVDELGYKIEWSSLQIKQFILSILYAQNNFKAQGKQAHQFLAVVDQIDALIYGKICFYLIASSRPNTITAFFEITLLLQGQGQIQRDIEVAYEQSFNALSQHPYCRAWLTDLLFEEAFLPSVYKAAENLGRNLPTQAFFKKQLSESTGYSQYCRYMFETSNRFFKVASASHHVPMLCLEDGKAEIALK
ncbi:MAG: hypothetical protein K0U37_07385 [Gammaproteobacteria bacterium]|nr:hypothetical protein [Gammaproteobacteria bacterium]